MPDVLRRPDTPRRPDAQRRTSASAAARRATTRRRAVLATVVVLGAVVMFFPFAWTVVTSLSDDAGLSATPQLIPQDPSLSAYQVLFAETPFARVVLNSLGLAVATTTCQLLTSALAAYVFSRIPIQVLIVPLFVQMRDLGLVDTYLGVLLPGVASAFGVFLLRQAMNAVPRELDEAATIDGAGHLRVFARIILPLVGPALATLAVFSFMSSWNAFLWPLIILRDETLQTLPLALAGLQGQYTTQWDVVMAGSVVSILPMLALYLFAQKYVIQGVASSGIK